MHHGLPQALVAAVGRDMTSEWLGSVFSRPDGTASADSCPGVEAPGYYRAFLRNVFYSPTDFRFVDFRFVLKQNRECAD
jgi:hypothetical protein